MHNALRACGAPSSAGAEVMGSIPSGAGGRSGAGLMARRGAVGPLRPRLPAVTTRDVRVFFACALVLSVLCTAMWRGAENAGRVRVKLRFGASGARDSSEARAAAAAAIGGEGEDNLSPDDATWAVEEESSSSDEDEDARRRRQERRARRQEKKAEAAAAAELASSTLAGGDGRKLQPGEGVEMTHTRIFETGSMLRDGRSTLEYAHMGMLEEIPGGHLMAAWQAAPDLEGGAEQSIYFAYSKDEMGREWGAPHRLPHGPPDKSVGASPGQWAPVLFQHGDTTWIFYSENSAKCLRPSVVDAPHPLPKRWIIGGSVYARTLKHAGPAPGGARDDGVGDVVGWSKPQVVYSQRQENTIPKLVANKLTALRTGGWILPFWRQRSTHVCASQRTHFNSAGVLRSMDEGKTWEAYGDLTLPGGRNKWVIEGTVVELTGKEGVGQSGGGRATLVMLLRSTEGYVYRSDSTDTGQTWSDPARTALVNPDSKIAALGLQDGRILIAFNDQQARTQGVEDVDKGLAVATKRRDTLVVAVSSASSPSTLRVFARLDEGKPGLMVHYPTLTVPSSRPGTLLVTYTRSYNNRSTAPWPREDGIWLAEMEIPGPDEEGAGGLDKSGYPARSMAIVGPGESAHTAVPSAGGVSGGASSSGASIDRLHAAMAAAQAALSNDDLVRELEEHPEQWSGGGGGAVTSLQAGGTVQQHQGQHVQHQVQHLQHALSYRVVDEDEDMGVM